MERTWLIVLLAAALAGCSGKANDRGDWAIEIRSQFDRAYIYADGDEKTTLVAEVDCERLLSWNQIGSLNERGFRELKCQERGVTKTYDLKKGLPRRDPPKEVAKPAVEHDYGCPVAAARLIKKMKKCDLETQGVTEELLCGKSSPIDSNVVRMVSNSDGCDELMRYLNIKK